MKKFDRMFTVIMVIFLVGTCIVTCYRGGKDLKVGLYGVKQVINKKSPYDNPLDPNRPLFRYAPGFALFQRPFLLDSRMTAPYKFEGILLSCFAWYWFVVFSLAISAILLLKLNPPAGRDAVFKLKLSLLLAMPLIAYELAAGQNKLLALAFLLVAVYFFEKDKYFLSGILLSLALTVYIPLVFFILYFAIRGRVRYMLNFIASAFLVFIVIPSVFIGIKFNAFLLKDWFVRCVKPFSFASSYTSYMELRPTNQSLPGAIGRLFIMGGTHPYIYIISPEIIHYIIRVLTAIIVLLSCFAAWKEKSNNSRWLSYIIFLSLALMLPMYCIIYTWSWLFVFYFVFLGYVDFHPQPNRVKPLAVGAIIVCFLASLSTTMMRLNTLSVLAWSTLAVWAIAVYMLVNAAKLENGREHAGS